MPKCYFNEVEIALWHGCNLLHIFRTLFSKNISGRLLLKICYKDSGVSLSDWNLLDSTNTKSYARLMQVKLVLVFSCITLSNVYSLHITSNYICIRTGRLRLNRILELLSEINFSTLCLSMLSQMSLGSCCQYFVLCSSSIFPEFR